jgi:hypothetical protein
MPAGVADRAKAPGGAVATEQKSRAADAAEARGIVDEGARDLAPPEGVRWEAGMLAAEAAREKCIIIIIT